MIRATAGPAGMYRNAASHVGGSSRLPSYCPPQGQYFGFSQTSEPMVRPANIPRVSKSTLSSSSSSVLSGARPVGGYSRVTASSCLDPLPNRHFGSRLSKGYSSIASRPEIYEQSYGVSYLPGYGRDSYSSYRIADSTIGDGEDLVSASHRRDAEVLRSVERQMAPTNDQLRLKNKLSQLAMLAKHGESYRQALIRMPPARSHMSSLDPRQLIDIDYEAEPKPYVPTSYAVRAAGKVKGYSDWPVPRVYRGIMPSSAARIMKARAKAKANAAYSPPVVRRTHMVRASSVPPQFGRPPVRVTKLGRVAAGRKPGGATVTVKARANADNDMFYRVPPPVVIHKHETVNKGSDLLRAQERLYGREAFDLTSPSGTTSLKMRINEVQNMLSKNGAMLGKYMAGPDADDIEVQAELRRIRTNREIRARSEA